MSKKGSRLEARVDSVEQYQKKIDKGTTGMDIAIHLDNPRLTSDYCRDNISRGDVLYELGTAPPSTEQAGRREVSPADFILIVSAEKVPKEGTGAFMQQFLRRYEVEITPSSKWAIDSHHAANDLKRCIGYGVARISRYCADFGMNIDIDDVLVKQFDFTFQGNPTSGHFFLCFSHHQDLKPKILDLDIFSDKEKDMLRQLIKGHFDTGDSITPSVDKFSDIRVVMALSRAVQQRFKDHPPEMVAALMLAMTDKNRNDLVERPEGMYLSRQCAERVSSYEVWLADDGDIIVTRKRFEGQSDEPKEDSQRFLNERLPNARKLGGIDSFEYALGLAMTFGLDQNRLPLSELAHALLSKSIETSDAAIRRVLELARGGSQEGLKALEEAVSWTRGEQTTDFYTPGLRMVNGFSALDDAPKKLFALAQQNALWMTPPRQVQELLSLSQVGGSDVRTLWSRVKELGCGQDQVRAIQLLGLHLAVQVILSRVEKP